VQRLAVLSQTAVQLRDTQGCVLGAVAGRCPG
jgi:hypothetical protein